jgi:hypothetical protein
LALQLRILLDTNVLIPLHDSQIALRPSLANVMRLAQGRHQLLYHPASVRDIQRDTNVGRRNETLQRLRQFVSLTEGPACPWNIPGLSDNDQCDNSILYALFRDAAHVLITEDRKLHAKAAAHNLGDRVYFIQTAEDWLRRLHEPHDIEIPNIVDVPLNELTGLLPRPFFNSLRAAYGGRAFDDWFREKARQGRQAWIYRNQPADELAALCVYDVQTNEIINDAGFRLPGQALKLCTFKVGEAVRGRKIGELFLKASFLYATANACEHIFIDVQEASHPELVHLLVDFGFEANGLHNRDTVYVKKHPLRPPRVPQNVRPFDYARSYYPHYRSDLEVSKFVIPIRPNYHQTLFNDYPGNDRRAPIAHAAHVGNAIKLAYLSGSPSGQIARGDLVLFYRTIDQKAITTLAVVERFDTSADAEQIAQWVSRRTVYSETDIETMAAAARARNRGVRVMLFRTLGHLPTPVPRAAMLRMGIRGQLQSTRRINNDTFSRILHDAGW